MQRLRKFSRLCLALLLATLVAACGSQPQAAPESPPQTGGNTTTAPAPAPPQEIDRPLFLSMAEIRPSAGEWNSLYTTDITQRAVYQQLWMSVGKFSPDAKLEPWLEESAVMSPDCLRATIKIHPKATWTDGTPVTAHDIEFTLRLRLKKELELPNPTSGAMGQITGTKDLYDGKTTTLAGVEVVDDKTVEIHFDSQQCLFFTLNGLHGIQPKHVLEPHWDNIMAAPYWKNPTVTNGPYRFVKLVADDHLEFERWDDWWGNDVYGKPKIKRVFLKQVQDPQVAASQAQAGELTIALIPASEASRFAAMPNLELHRRPTMGITSLGFNARSFPDPRTRQAMAYAMNLREFIDLAHDGSAEPVATTVIGPDWAKNPNVKPFDQDLVKARALLAESGFDTSKKLRYVSSSAADKRPELFQAAMKEIGLDVEIQVLAPGVWRERQDAGEWEVTSIGGGVFGVDPAINCQYYASDASWAKVRSGYKNDRIDEICAGLVGTIDRKERQRLSHELDALLQSEMIWVTIGQVYNTYAADKRLGGYVASTYHPGHQIDGLINWYWKE